MDVISVPERLVRDPATRRVVDETPLAIDPNDPTWARLLADGDVVEALEPEPAPAPTKAAAPAAASQDDKA